MTLEVKAHGLPNDFKAVTASDTVALPSRIIKVRIGDISGGSVVAVQNFDGDTVTFTNVLVGTELMIPGAKLLLATGTTASDFIIYFYR